MANIVLDFLRLSALIAGLTMGAIGLAHGQNGPSWKVGFFDDFDSFNPNNWRDQILWVNNEDQCYVRDGLYGTREVSQGTLKLRVVDLGKKVSCDNVDKHGKQHYDTQYVAGRISSKNRQEFSKGRWTARLRVKNSGQDGMFPAWWLLGAYNNEPPVEEADETVCWPMTGSGEIDIFEHHSDGGPDHYAARTIKNQGACDKGDWQSLMLVRQATLAEFNNYGVEWRDKDIVFLFNGKEVYRNEGIADELAEPMFAILNFAKINQASMTETWEMEVDWVKWEYLE
ncbi:glycoside hydrolase family 16 protein [Alteromonas sediminis]|uniref:Glycoside hydrolase family 16 protein n=1 Tax=Alteromonas sediminis TaxID=2259342 RepID=A0A3N5Y816_9ALTE|nr:glycoside hydrolase family 16 protein [Alteromonas sediminis]RPJ67049.1 glycoside hydrolase family 16 protein [Alteromonas sediminis]